MNWDGISKFVGDIARPFAIIINALAIAICCFIPATADYAISAAAAIVIGHGYFRSMDKKNTSIAASAEGVVRTGDAAVPKPEVTQ